MIFIFLTFLAAFGIEGIGTYVSIIGLSKTFAHDPVIMTLAVALDLCKLVVVSLLYKKWDSLSWLMKGYFLPAAVVLMTITSYGAAGYLSNSFQAATLPIQKFTITLKADRAEHHTLTARKKQIDDGISSIGSNYISKRLEEKRQVKPELDKISNRLEVLNTDILKLEQNIKVAELHVGPISYMSAAFDISMEDAVKLIIMLIIFVFDPLAIMLLIAGNFLIAESSKVKVTIPDIEDEPDEPAIEDENTIAEEPYTGNTEAIVESVVDDVKAIMDNLSSDEPSPSIHDHESLKNKYKGDIKSDFQVDDFKSDITEDSDGPTDKTLDFYTK